MAAISSPTGVDGVIASGNTPVWIVQTATVTPALTEASTTFPLDALDAADTVKIDCHINMDGFSTNRTVETKERQRMCEAVKVKRKTGEAIDVTLQAVYDQQAAPTELINAVYTALPEGGTVYAVQAFGWDSHKKPTAETVVDVYRFEVTKRTKNQPVQGEDLMFTVEGSGDLFVEDAKLAAAV